ncbi:DUF3179 domain-containing protein [soil metagenome]
MVPSTALSQLAGFCAVLLFAFGNVMAEAPDSLAQEFPKTDFSKRTTSLDDFRAGGPPRDGIPAIDRPEFINVEEAAGFLDEREPVILLSIGSDVRAYPLQILIWHEIVNDTVGGLPVVVTFCPLCNAALVFERRIDGVELDFGTTGRLRLSDLVMYDRRTESWWQQFTGEGLIGEHAGRELREVPSQIVSFHRFAEAHPAGRVLSRRTGYRRPYGQNPYRGYDSIDSSPFMLKGKPDPRLPPMERVLGVHIDGKARIYPLSRIEERGVIEDELAGTPLVVVARKGMLSVLDEQRIDQSRKVPAAAAFRAEHTGRRLHFEKVDGEMRDRETGSRWNLLGAAVEGPLKGAELELLPGGVHFAFAWLAFRPGSEVYAADF